MKEKRGETIEREKLGNYWTKGSEKPLNEERWETTELEETGIYEKEEVENY